MIARRARSVEMEVPVARLAVWRSVWRSVGADWCPGDIRPATGGDQVRMTDWQALGDWLRRERPAAARAGRRPAAASDAGLWAPSGGHSPMTDQRNPIMMKNPTNSEMSAKPP